MSLPIHNSFNYLFKCILVLLTFMSCTGGKKVDDAAARAAKEYYDSLFVGNYAYFVRGTYLSDTIPPTYREQLEANASMFRERMYDEHHGVHEVRIMNFENDTLPAAHGRPAVYTSSVFLVFCLGDSLNEEIVVPMIYHGDRWLMR